MGRGSGLLMSPWLHYGARFRISIRLSRAVQQREETAAETATEMATETATESITTAATDSAKDSATETTAVYSSREHYVVLQSVLLTLQIQLQTCAWIFPL